MQFTKVLEWWRAHDKKCKLRIMRDLFYKEFVFHTCKIDVGISRVQVIEVLSTGNVTNYTGSVRKLLSVLNAKAAYNLFEDFVGNNGKVTVALLTQFHKLAMFGTIEDDLYASGERAGSFKNKRFKNVPTYENNPYHGISVTVEDIVAKINKYKSVDVSSDLEYVSICHAAFYDIAPFAAGNKEVGRWLLNMHLMSLDYPPLIISYDYLLAYEEAMRKYHDTCDTTALTKVIKDAIIKTWINMASDAK